MGTLLLSTLGTLSPLAYDLFVVIVAVGFFGIYIPWNEKKKRRQSADPQTERPERKPAAPLGRGQAVAMALLCLPVAVVGLTMLIAGGAAGKPLPLLLGAILSIASLLGMKRAGRDLRAARRQPPPQPPRPAAPVGAQEQARLDQLDSLLDAGVLTPAEYRERRSQILEGKR